LIVTAVFAVPAQQAVAFVVAACWLEVTVDPAGSAEPSTILLTKFVPLSHGAAIVNDMPEVFAVGTLRVATPLLTLTEVPSQNVGLAGVILLGLPPVMARWTPIVHPSHPVTFSVMVVVGDAACAGTIANDRAAATAEPVAIMRAADERFMMALHSLVYWATTLTV
jgi:hypothetical protein